MTEQWAGVLWQRFRDLYGHKWAGLFQGDEAIESWRITWAQGLDVSAEQIKFALSRIGSEFPDWPPTFGQFKSLCGCAPKSVVLALRKPEYRKPSEAIMNELKRVAKTRPTGEWWTVDKVENEFQVAHIVRQAQHFGALSPASRFLDECKAAGIITHDNRLGVLNRREPGQDDEERAVDVPRETLEPEFA